MAIWSGFLLYLVDKHVKGAATGIRVQDGTTAIKTLTPTCTTGLLYDGGQATCAASDTSTDAYYFDRAYLLRSSYTIDGVTSNEVGYIATTRTYKESSQTLQIEIYVPIKALH